MSNTMETTIWIGWEEINQRAKGRKIICFGRGEWLEKTMNYIPKDIDYVVDNNQYEWGQKELGLGIYKPDRLLSENLDECFVIITNTSFRQVAEQLNSYGFKSGWHFCVSPALKSYYAISHIKDHDGTVFLTCSDRYLKDDQEKGGGVYSYDLRGHELRKIHNGLCHGIVKAEDRFYLIDDVVGVRVLDAAFECVDVFELPAKSRPHGIAYCPDRKRLFINFSGMDAIGIYDVDKRDMVDLVRFSDKYEKTRIAHHHLNDLCVYGNSLFVSMFSFSGNWKIGVFDGGVFEIDIDSLELRQPIVSNLWMPHTPTMINGQLFYCDSMRGRVHNTSWKPFIRDFNGFVRGIAYDGVFYYIGQSQHRYLDRCEGYSNNVALDSGFYMVEGAGKVAKFFSTPQLVDINTVFVLKSRKA